jgi:hypothetical protein
VPVWLAAAAKWFLKYVLLEWIYEKYQAHRMKKLAAEKSAAELDKEVEQLEQAKSPEEVFSAQKNIVRDSDDR